MPTTKPNMDGFRRYLYQNVDNIRGYPIRRIGGVGYEEPTEKGSYSSVTSRDLL